MNTWLSALNHCHANGLAHVVVTIIALKGSAPRGVGARLVVTREHVSDTIGGGRLEQEAIVQARALLQQQGTNAIVQSRCVVLGQELAQCCGGEVTLQFEYSPGARFRLYVFGAGHVAQAIAKIVADLPCHTTFIDARTHWLEKIDTQNNGAGQIQTQRLHTNPVDVVEGCADRSYFLVMTHSHELDFEFVEAILTRGDSRYCGLIASKSKAQRFRNRLKRKGFTQSELQLLTAPIGNTQVKTRYPMEIALASCTQIMQIQAASLHSGALTCHTQ